MRRIAIIGTGPRGLSSLENFFIVLSENVSSVSVHITLFENSSRPGSGSVWDIEQPATNWLNISERALGKLSGRPALALGRVKVPAFPSYTQWLPEAEQNPGKETPDRFPPRAKMGTYLQMRFTSIADVLIASGLVTLVSSSVEDIDFLKDQFTLKDYQGESYLFDEVLLAVGHQPTKLSEQLEEWKEHTKDNPNLCLFEKPYPAEDISSAAHIDQDSVVGVRGFGLAMIDVARALTIGKGGKFEIVNDKTLKSNFVTSENVPRKIVAFSLDGNPMAPKPLNAQIDEWFTPTVDEKETFCKKIERVASGQEKVHSTMFLKEAMATIAARIYLHLENHQASSEEVYQTIIDWLSDESVTHPLIQPIGNSAQDNMRAFARMALGEKPISLDYCIGQVWRHCQPSLYTAFAHAKLPSEIIASVIALDERTKRYSYGPPVESTQQLLALLEADVLTLDFVANPEISVEGTGWELVAHGKSITANTMINSVLDPPRLLEVASPVVCNLLGNALIEPIHSALGVHTERNACIELSEEKDAILLAVLGRLSKGSVLGVDTILECFSPNERAWAEGAVQRLLTTKQPETTP